MGKSKKQRKLLHPYLALVRSTRKGFFGGTAEELEEIRRARDGESIKMLAKF